MGMNLPLGSEYITGDGGGLAFKLISNRQVVCTKSAPHWQRFFQVGHLYSIDHNDNLIVEGDWKSKPWVGLRFDGRIIT